MKNLYVLGISHECAEASKIGAYALAPSQCLVAQGRILESPLVEEATVLCTCNRMEVYYVADSDASSEAVIEALSKSGETPRDMSEFEKICYLKKNADAAVHLFEVASGLRSQMVGETEIFGQVKAAYARSSEAGHCGAILNPFFQKVSQCAKWIRTNTDIGHGKISVGSVGVELAARIFEDLENARILLLGSGDVGKLVADALYVRGSHDIIVASRTRANADALALKIGCTAADLGDAIASIADFDIVICASFSREPLVKCGHLRAAMGERQSKPMFLIDLAVPHNIEDACADIDDAYLYNLSDLSKIANENINARKAEIARAHIAASDKARYLCAKLGLSDS